MNKKFELEILESKNQVFLRQSIIENKLATKISDQFEAFLVLYVTKILFCQNGQLNDLFTHQHEPFLLLVS